MKRVLHAIATHSALSKPSLSTFDRFGQVRPKHSDLSNMCEIWSSRNVKNWLKLFTPPGIPYYLLLGFSCTVISGKKQRMTKFCRCDDNVPKNYATVLLMQEM